ncbi:MAG: alpha/beta fold hydrolase [Acidobacteriales bacterium]|nr:alpha/beta fold hydrolase [Terriglobales bacterium]
MQETEFIPFPFLNDRHLMTMAAALWPRTFTVALRRPHERLFEVEPGTALLAHCHWLSGARRRPTLVILHGLEGSSTSHYVLGLTEKALLHGMNVVRLNLRNCGGTLHLTPTLYNAGLTRDPLSVVRELKQKDELEQIYLVGYSIGGNLVLKAAAELANTGPQLLAGVCAVSPSLDLPPCVDALEEGFNRFYEQRFLRGLKAKLLEKHRLFPELYDKRHLPKIKRLRQFDEIYTAPNGGYGNADNYYRTASALPQIDRVSVPVLIVQAQDDPFVPFSSFRSAKLDSPWITLLAPRHGGHAAFIHENHEAPPAFDRFWAENRVVTFCLETAADLSGRQLKE